MRILIDARFYGLEHAGLGRYTINMVRELSKTDRVNKYVVLLRKKHFDQLNLPNNWVKVEFDIPHYTVREQLLLPRVINMYNPDIFHAFHVNVPILYTGKFVVTIHDLIQTNYQLQATTLPKFLYFIKSLAIKIAAYAAVKRSSAIIVPSKAVREDIREKYNTNSDIISVIYEGADNLVKTQKHARAKKKLNISGDYLFYVGNAYPHKNVEILIDAVKTLITQGNKKIKLVVSGSRDVFKERLEKYANANGINKRVIFTGYVDDGELALLYRKALAFVYPSKMEGFGLQGLEAMRNKTILIASDIKVFKELYGKHAIYFDPDSKESLMSAIEKVRKMPKQEKDKIVEKARKYSYNFRWNIAARETLSIYNSLQLS